MRATQPNDGTLRYPLTHPLPSYHAMLHRPTHLSPHIPQVVQGARPLKNTSAGALVLRCEEGTHRQANNFPRSKICSRKTAHRLALMQRPLPTHLLEAGLTTLEA